MVRRIVYTRLADRDLQSLYAYIRDRRDDPMVAIAYVRRIRAFCERLADLPERGRRRDDLAPGLRVITFERRCVVCFRVDADEIRIIRVCYGGRDYERIFQRR